MIAPEDEPGGCLASTEAARSGGRLVLTLKWVNDSYQNFLLSMRDRMFHKILKKIFPK